MAQPVSEVTTPGSPAANMSGNIPSTPAPVNSYPLLTKPIVIPQALGHPAHSKIMCRPFTRCYAKILSSYNISEDEFLAFLDELNIEQVAHVGLDYTKKAGSVVKLAGHFDPTGITHLVGQTIHTSAVIGQAASVGGPMSKKKQFIAKANKDLFGPRGLRVSIVSGKELRTILGVDPKFPLCAPLMMSWVVPSREELKKGRRSKFRVADRILHQLLPYVEEVTLVKETNQSLLVTGSFAQKKAAKTVSTFQVDSEVQHQIWRGEALALYARAERVKSVMEKQKLNKKGDQMDKEWFHVEYIDWLVVQNLGPGSKLR